MAKRSLTLAIAVESQILILRHHRIILDSDLAELYGVTVKRLNRQVNRNQEHFPTDFMLQLTSEEDKALRLQIATSKKGRGGRRYPPLCVHGARGDHGDDRAELQAGHRDERFRCSCLRPDARDAGQNRQLAAKINELDRRLETHDTAIQDTSASPGKA
jgi:ORF6N domain